MLRTFQELPASCGKAVETAKTLSRASLNRAEAAVLMGLGMSKARPIFKTFLAVPPGLGKFRMRPRVKTRGYFRLSLRDKCRRDGPRGRRGALRQRDSRFGSWAIYAPNKLETPHVVSYRVHGEPRPRTLDAHWEHEPCREYGDRQDACPTVHGKGETSRTQSSLSSSRMYSAIFLAIGMTHYALFGLPAGCPSSLAATTGQTGGTFSASGGRCSGRRRGRF